MTATDPPPRQPASHDRAGPGLRGRAGPLDADPGWQSFDRIDLTAATSGLGGGPAPAEAGSLPASARLPATAGGVATWLPEGRWAAPADAASAPADGSPDPERVGPGATGPAREPRDTAGRRRGRHLVAATRVAARLAGWPRRLLAGALLLAAVAVALRPPEPSRAVAPSSPGVPVVVVARDLPAGTTLAATDLRTVALPAGAVPAGAAREVRALLGRTVAGPVRRGEAVTDARLVGPGLTIGLGPAESAAVPVRLADPETATLVRAGDRVDVLGTPVDPGGAGDRGTDAVEVAAGVRVLAVLRGSDPSDGVVLVVAAAPAVARRLAGAAARHRLTVSMRPP